MSPRAPLAALASALAIAGGDGAAAPGRPGAGERLYLDGIGADGAAVSGTVQGDVTLDGAQASCAACHGRSGFGSAEGGRVVPPVTGAALRAPLVKGPRRRPAYDGASLARAIRDGVDPGGRPLDALMPRYRLADADLAALTAYLGRLAARPAPGASDREMHVATIVTPDAPPAAREAALGVVRAWVAAQDEAARVERGGHPRGRFGEVQFAGEWRFHAWRLRGPPAGWRAQLEAFQRAQPVFAVIGGAGGAWEPVERFCEEERLPCLLPNVDAPPAAAGRWYTRHYSAGPALEAEVIADRVAAAGSPRVLSVYRDGVGAAAARALAAALARRGLPPPAEYRVRGTPRLHSLAAKARESGAGAVALWLDGADVAALPGAGAALGLPLYSSGTLLGDGEAPDAALGGMSRRVQPWAPSGDAGRAFLSASTWLGSRGLRPGDGPARRWQDQALFAARAFGMAFQHLGGNWSRELLMEKLDHAPGIAILSSYYPRLAFGPGQRFASKGCWVVPVAGPESAAEWVVP